LAAARLRCFARKRLEKPLGGLSEQVEMTQETARARRKKH